MGKRMLIWYDCPAICQEEIFLWYGEKRLRISLKKR